MSSDPVAVFGGTGFLGRRLVATLLSAGYRVRLVARRPERVHFESDLERRLARLSADITNQSQVERAVAGCASVINAVSLYEERGGLTFRAIHVSGAARLAAAARAAGVSRLVQVSGIGADEDSPSAYVRARARGEAAVREAFPEAVIARPSVLFGQDDALLSALVTLARLPVAPLFGRGDTRLQPVYVEDLAAALARLAMDPAQPEPLYELGGGEVYHYREMLDEVRAWLGHGGLNLPVPFPVWRGLAAILHCLPGPTPLTRDQVRLMENDNVVGKGAATFADLDMAPSDFAGRLADCLDGRTEGA